MKKREERKERFINLGFKMDVDPTCNPKMVIYANDENQPGCKVKVFDVVKKFIDIHTRLGTKLLVIIIKGDEI